MHHWTKRCGILLGLLALSSSASAQGLKGLGPPGGLSDATPEVLALEIGVLADLNAQFRKGKAALRMDEKLRGFARANAGRAARGELKADAIPGLIESRRLAPFGFYFQFVFGANRRELIAAVRKDRELSRSVAGDFKRVGVGAFYAPAEKPFYQVMLFLAKDIDPRAGQPGLSKAETDPVMETGVERMKSECYDPKLADNPNFKGRALFELVIDGDGGVATQKLLRGLRDELFDGCLLNVVAELRFPKPYKGVPVTLRHPVVFRPPQGDEVIGKLNDGQVRATFAGAALDFRKCYNARTEKLKGRKLKGTILVSVDVTPKGNVSAVDVVENSTRDNPLEDCVVTRIKKLRFPQPKFGGPVTVDFPLDFGS
ncbi:MAG: TonB family protein [Myxococcota bacterium]